MILVETIFFYKSAYDDPGHHCAQPHPVQNEKSSVWVKFVIRGKSVFKLAESTGAIGSIGRRVDGVLIPLGVYVEGVDGVGEEHDASAEDESFHECEEEQDA